ncbi:GNAT family N-acetyltransferase [Streptomyces sp. NBC_00503]|uniref:GNAT family N-acetyltransferase n=1 Tax=Streptomyces sp. NBC_00503 TaxID=2903659 RepID=UPI002E802093|nr:GNAT family N-acetyltransferase [Streptomyces sp. NBC_00503]WUD86402.1 GNAT family N-acetyltransferase [Streptomyces sp. NBC_00503]
MPERTDRIHHPDGFREVYHRVYREPPYREDEAAADAFAVRLAEHAALPGFRVTTVHADGALAGFAYGVHHPGGWWHPRAAAPPPRELAGPLFYVYELALLPELRGRGHGRALLDLLLADRTEPFAVLAASTGAPAHTMYRRWGWTKAGRLTGPPDGVDILARPLPHAPTAAPRTPPAPTTHHRHEEAPHV